MFEKSQTPLVDLVEIRQRVSPRPTTNGDGSTTNTADAAAPERQNPTRATNSRPHGSLPGTGPHLGGTPPSRETNTVGAAPAAGKPASRPAESDIDRAARSLRESRSRHEESRRRFQDFVLASSDWIWETDANATIVYVSNRAAEIIGRPVSLVRGMNLFDIGTIPENDNRESLLEAVKARRPFRAMALDITDPQGRRRRCHLNGMPVFDDSTGRFLGYRGTGTDATPRFEAEERATRYRHKLEYVLEEIRNKNIGLEMALSDANAATRAKSEFLANVSHELRTPLNAIIGFTEMMHSERFGSIENERYKDYLKDILDSANHLLEVITDLLEMSRIEAGRLQVRKEKIDLAEIIDSCRRAMEERARSCGVTLSIHVPPSIPKLSVDHRMFKQMLLNLLSNSLKFTPRGGRVSIDVESREDGRVVVRISDTGIGIAKVDFPKVLMPFGQVENPFNTKYPGTGLGLPLVKAMIELHDGELGLESEVGVGTTISLRFPVESVH